MINNSNSDESIQILIKLGLSISQAKVYFTLLASNANTARDISAICKISRPDVYRVLTELEENSFVERAIANPTQYNAIPLEISIPNLMLKKKKEMEEISNKIPLLIQNIKELNSKNPMSSKSDFTLISKGSVSIELEKKTKQAKESIFVVATAHASANRVWFRLEILEPALEEALLKKIDVKLVLLEPQNEKIKEMISKRVISFSNFQISYTDQPSNITLGIFDKKEVLIGTQPLGGENFSFLWSNNVCLLDLCQAYFNSHWKK